MSYFEVYNEKIHDLLVTRDEPNQRRMPVSCLQLTKTAIFNFFFLFILAFELVMFERASVSHSLLVVKLAPTSPDKTASLPPGKGKASVIAYQDNMDHLLIIANLKAALLLLMPWQHFHGQWSG